MLFLSLYLIFQSESYHLDPLKKWVNSTTLVMCRSSLETTFYQVISGRADNNIHQLTNEVEQQRAQSLPRCSGANIVSGNIQAIIKLLGILVSCRWVKWVTDKLFKNLQIRPQVGFLMLCFNHDKQYLFIFYNSHFAQFILLCYICFHPKWFSSVWSQQYLATLPNSSFMYSLCNSVFQGQSVCSKA